MSREDGANYLVGRLRLLPFVSVSGCPPALCVGLFYAMLVVQVLAFFSSDILKPPQIGSKLPGPANLL
jgi:hypothetical protein